MGWQRHNRQCVGAGRDTRTRQCWAGRATRARQCRGWQIQEPGSVGAGKYKSQAVSGLANTRARQCRGWQRYNSQAVSGLAEVQEPGSVGLAEVQEPGRVGAGRGTRARQCWAGRATRARQCRGWQRYKSQAVSGLAALQEPGSVSGPATAVNCVT